MYIITSNGAQKNKILAGQTLPNSGWKLNKQKNTWKDNTIGKKWTKKSAIPALGKASL